MYQGQLSTKRAPGCTRVNSPLVTGCSSRQADLPVGRAKTNNVCGGKGPDHSFSSMKVIIPLVSSTTRTVTRMTSPRSGLTRPSSMARLTL